MTECSRTGILEFRSAKALPSDTSGLLDRRRFVRRRFWVRRRFVRQLNRPDAVVLHPDLTAELIANNRAAHVDGHVVERNSELQCVAAHIHVHESQRIARR